MLIAFALVSCGGGGGRGAGNSGAGQGTPTDATAGLPARDALVARARSFGLDTPYVPPPGDPLEHNTAGFAKTMCSNVFISGMDPGVDPPDFDPGGTYPDPIYFYTGRINAFNYAAMRPQQWPPNTVGRYRDTDPVLVNYLIRLAVEKRGDDYLSFPQRALFDKIGVRSMTIEPDPYGNFLTQRHDFMSARDRARLGNLFEGWRVER